MCKSFDTNPVAVLSYVVTFGDGGAGASGCSIAHDYGNLGTYFATACVNSETEGGACQPYTVTVGDSCAVNFSNIRGVQIGKSTCLISVDAQTSGTSTCGDPLTAGISIQNFSSFPGSFTQGTSVTCKPGQPCTLGFQVPSGFGFGSVVSGNAKGGPLNFCQNFCNVNQVASSSSCG
jgi:hypothetical protein